MSSKVKYEILYLSRRTFTSAYVRSEPLIHEGRTRYEQEIRQGSYQDKETRGYFMVQGLWNHQVDTIIDVKLGDSDTDTYKY